MIKSIDKKYSRWAIFLSVIALVASFTLGSIWIFDVKELSVVNSDTFISALIAVLGLLFTILMGWNIYSVIDVRQYRDEMNKTKQELDSRDEKQVNISQAYAYYGLAELYLEQKKYVSSYLKYISSVLYFEKANEYNLALHAYGRIYFLIRALIRKYDDNKGTYVLDNDMHDDLSYGKDLAELYILELGEYDAKETHKTFMHYLTMYSKRIKVENTTFSVYSRDADIKQCPIAIYLLMNDNEFICKTMSYDKYLGLLQCELKLNHNIVAIAEFTSLEECKEVYDKIDAEEIIGFNKRNIS